MDNNSLMDTVVLVVDNFLHDPKYVRELGMKAKYIDWVGSDQVTYKRICVCEVPGLRDSLEKVMGPVEMKGMAFRLNYDGELPNSSIHTDVGWGTHAMVLYLNEGLSGTAFWKHRESGAVGMEPGDLQTFCLVKDDTEDEAKWEMTKMVHMKFNRAAIYSSKLFHSRYPFKAFGQTPQNGRLTAVAFFTPLTKEREDQPNG